MALETFERAPPPFFRRGLSALSRLAIFSALSVLLLVADARWRVVDPLRAALVSLVHPLQQALFAPVHAAQKSWQQLQGLQHARAQTTAARAELARLAAQAARAGQLEQDNAALRALLGLREESATRSRAAQVLYEAADPYARRVFIDRGERDGVQAGSPVINEAGVLGQVTRLYPATSEVTLLTDRQAAIPVLNERTRSRGAAFGSPSGQAMELRFAAANADVREGDLLVTSGLDGVYPPGLNVARVASVDRLAGSAFAVIELRPAAQPDGVRHVLVLEPHAAGLPAPLRPPPAAAGTAQAAPRASRQASAPASGARR